MARSKTNRQAIAGFVYIWFDRKHSRYYIGSHWGDTGDGYICSSRWMNAAYRRRPEDFKRKIIKIMDNRKALLAEEERLIRMIKPHEIGTRYYNLNVGGVGHWSANEEEQKRITLRKISLAKTGLKHSDETKTKLSVSNKKSHNTPKMKQWHSDHAKALWEDDSHRENVSIKYKEKWADPEWKARTIAAQTAAQNTPEQKAIISEASKECWQNPDYREKVLESRRLSLEENGTWCHTEEQKEQNRQRGLELWQDPAHREKLLASRDNDKCREAAKKNLAKADRSKAIEARRATAARQKLEREANPELMAAFKEKQRQIALKRWSK